MESLKKIFLFFFIFILLVGTISAADFDNIKSYDPETKTVTIKNSVLGIPFLELDTVAEIKLNTPLVNYVSAGYGKVAEMEMNIYEDYNNAFKELELYDLKKSMKEFKRDYDYKILSYETILVDDYEVICNEIINLNETINEECEKFLVGNHEEQKEVWTKLTPSDFKKNDKVTIGIFTEVEVGDRFEWIPNFFGVRIEEWAVVINDLQSNLKYYYKLDGNNRLIDSSGNYNLTSGGTEPTNRSGIINDARSFNSNGYYNISNNGELDLKKSLNWTLNFWYVNVSSGNSFILEKGYNTGGARLGFLNKKVHYHTGGPNNWQNSSINNYTDNTQDWWMMSLVHVSGESKIRIFLNGTNTENISFADMNDATTGNSLYLGFESFNTIYLNGSLDEVGFWNNSLSTEEIEYLYKGGIGRSYNFEDLSITLNSPVDNYNSPTTSNIFNCSAQDSSLNLTNISLWHNASGTWEVNQTISTGDVNETTQIFTTNLQDGSVLWSCEACNSNSSCGFASENRTINVDTIYPTINITSPPSIVGYHLSGNNLSLNWSVTDANLDSCWYNYNGTNNTLTCSANTTSFISTNQKNLTFYANDTAGNVNSTFHSWEYLILEINKTFNNETTEGSIEEFELFLIKSPTIDVESVILYYDGQNYTSSLYSSSNQVTAISEVFIQGVATDTNKTFYFSINLDDSSQYNTTNEIQLVRNIEIDDCSVQPSQFLFFNLLDEETQTDIYGDLEVEITFLNPTTFQEVLTLNGSYTNVTNKSFCTSTNANETGFLLTFQVKYDSDNHSAEFYNIQRSDLSEYPKTYSLYDLKDSDTTIFKVNYAGEDLLGVPGAIIQLQRKYISEGAYKIVEAPLTSSSSSAIVHIDTNTNLYKITVVKNGVLLNTFENINFICQSELTGECSIDLTESLIPPTSVSIETLKDFSYSLDTDTENKSIEITYSIPSGTTSTINVYGIQEHIVGNTTICNNTVSSAGGSVECLYNDSIQDSIIYYYVSKNGELLVQKSYVVGEDLRDDFQKDNYFILAIFLISLVFMALSSPEFMLLNGVLTFIIGGATWLVRGMDFVLGIGATAWLFLVVVIIIIKMANKEDL